MQQAVAFDREHARPLMDRLASMLRRGGGLKKAAAEEAAFHLCDWYYDLTQLKAFFDDPESKTPAEAYKLILSFVNHAPAHMAAAHRILMGDPLEDIFELGAFRGTGEAKRVPGEPYSWMTRSGATKKTKTRSSRRVPRARSSPSDRN